jgi:wyosine [tRNA(Phe)-imidazoG37] synthetase (radical SAM superfamily)
MMLLPLPPEILYGPINSRRLGKSLGTNLMPGKYKLCSFNFVYCHYGWTKKHTSDFSQYHRDLPSPDKVIRAVGGALKSSMEFSFLTFSGNGEPTLYPQFAELVEEVANLRNKYRPQLKVALLSNSTGLVRQDIRESLSKIGYLVLKIDAGTEIKFEEVNRPATGVNFSDILNSLSTVEHFFVQTVFIDGIPSNTADDDLSAYFQKISQVQPKEAHIYSIDRPVADRKILLVAKKRLEEIAIWGEKESGVKIRPFYLQ